MLPGANLVSVLLCFSSMVGHRCHKVCGVDWTFVAFTCPSWPLTTELHVDKDVHIEKSQTIQTSSLETENWSELTFVSSHVQTFLIADILQNSAKKTNNFLLMFWMLNISPHRAAVPPVKQSNVRSWLTCCFYQIVRLLKCFFLYNDLKKNLLESFTWLIPIFLTVRERIICLQLVCDVTSTYALSRAGVCSRLTCFGRFLIDKLTLS